MTQIYEATYKALSPIHIGYKSIGILDTTRYYITGKVLWGAMTASVTRHLIDTPGKEEYKCVGEIVRENIRTTYFFPKVENTVYYPIYEERELRYGTLSKSAFEKTFIYSFVSTALDKTKTADENTLHEVEYIKNRVRIADDPKDVYWIGYLFVKDGIFSANENKKGPVLEVKTEKEDFTVEKGDREMRASEILRKIQVGGERNYGFGNLRLEGTFRRVDRNTDNEFGCELEGGMVKSEKALGHVYYEDVPYTGEIEPFVGREWGEKGSGRETSINKGGKNTPCVFFVPGTRFECELWFDVEDYGMWIQKKGE